MSKKDSFNAVQQADVIYDLKKENAFLKEEAGRLKKLLGGPKRYQCMYESPGVCAYEKNLRELQAEIAELKKRIKHEHIDNLEHKIRQRDVIIDDLKNTIAELKEHLQEICPHDGDSKNGVCFECGGDI